mgnify:CR=1 FL=1
MAHQTSAGDRHDLGVDRRAVLKAAVASTTLGVAGTASARGASPERGPGTGDAGSNPNYIDPIFGKTAAEGNPCLGRADTDCFGEFRPPVRPDHEVEMLIGIEGLVFGLAEAGVLTSAQIEALNTAVADGSLAGDDSLLDFAVEFDERPVPARVIAEALLATHGFHFGPAGVHVRPGDTVLFSAESPDHAVTVYHEGHGRQNRVPDGVGPISSPLVPVGGYWLFRFETTGVYDVYCPPHDPFGMNMRVVVSEGDTVPPLDVEQTGRPPTAENALPSILGGLDPNVPSSAEVLASDALDPAEIVAEGTVPWHRVVDEHRQG